MHVRHERMVLSCCNHNMTLPQRSVYQAVVDIWATAQLMHVVLTGAGADGGGAAARAGAHAGRGGCPGSGPSGAGC